MTAASTSVSVLASRMSRGRVNQRVTSETGSAVENREGPQDASAALLDYFRYPPGLLSVAPAGVMSADPGYFAFGSIPCYAHCSAVTPRASAGATLPEVAAASAWDDGQLRLPFDLTQAIGNLRQERYRQQEAAWPETLAGTRLMRAAYYAVRPLLRVGVRKHLQRWRFRGWDRIAFPQWPVDVSVERLMQETVRQMLLRSGAGRLPFIWFWPDGATACAMMTHDVEGGEGGAFCGALMDIDEEFDIASSFQIIPEPVSQSKPLLETIRARGFEVNVHDLNHDCSLFADPESFQSKAAAINRYVRQFGSAGFRSGVMYREQSWYGEFEFAYDMSVPNVAHLEPQRGGCCTVMPYFIGNILELPLTTTQDYTLFHILGDYSTELWREQIAAILAQHGLISFIAHPDYLRDSRALTVYRQLLEHLRDLRASHNVWVAPPRAINDWWRSRHAMSLIPAGDGWRIEGPNSERACVAYATLEGDRIVYSLAAS